MTPTHHRARSLDTLPAIDRAVSLVMRELLSHDKRTHDQISAAMGVPRTTMSGALHGKQRWSLSTLELLCRELSVSVAWTMTQAGYGGAPSVTDIIAADTRLTPADKVELRRLYLSRVTPPTATPAEG